MEANKKLKLGKLFSPQNLRLYLYYLTTPSGKKKSYSHGYIKYFLKSNWNERTHFKLLPRPFSISKKCPSTEGIYKEYFTICNIHMYVWRLPPHTQKFTVRSVWGFLANFPTLRHSFHSTDFYFLIFFIFILFLHNQRSCKQFKFEIADEYLIKPYVWRKTFFLNCIN